MRSKNNVGKRVAEARTRLKPPLTQARLVKRLRAAGVEISLARLADIESGVYGPHQMELIGLAEVLSTSVHWLMTGLGR